MEAVRIKCIRFIVWLLRIETSDVVWVDYYDCYQPRWTWDRDLPLVTIGPAIKLSGIAQSRRCDGFGAEIITGITTRSKDTDQ